MKRLAFKKTADPEFNGDIRLVLPHLSMFFWVSGAGSYEENKKIVLQVGIDPDFISDEEVGEDGAVLINGIRLLGRTVTNLNAFKSTCMAFKEVSQILNCLEKLPFNMEVRIVSYQ